MTITQRHDASEFTLRALDAADRPGLERLAQRDSSAVPREPLLGVEAGGRLLAATSLADGATIADPFLASGEARAVLELRAAQLRAAHNGGRRLRGLLRARPEAAVAGSPRAPAEACSR